MKKITFILLAVMCFAAVAQAQSKIAHINSSELLDLLPETDSIQKRLQKEQEDWQNILQEKKTEATNKYNKLMEIADDPNVSQQVKEIKAKEVENLQIQYQELQQRANTALQEKQEELLTPLLDKVKQTIADVAKENGYDYVIDATEGGGLIYSNPSSDLMPLVKAKLGI
jgi:outer membrane protein